MGSVKFVPTYVIKPYTGCSSIRSEPRKWMGVILNEGITMCLEIN
jgi:hypothetical protein